MTGVAVIGTGFMGVAHTEALRRLGLDVVGIVGSSPERARAKAATTPLPPSNSRPHATVSRDFAVQNALATDACGSVSLPSS